MHNVFKKLTLENGLRLVYEQLPFLRSASVGIWVKTGSADENENNNGISHFIEHMMFKGTEKMSAKQIAQSIESLGGQLNAFTGKECTCYYAKTLDEHLDTALDVLSEILFHSKFASEDIDKERSVIIEEINMYEDTPDELVHDLFTKLVWGGSSFGMPILGTKNSLERIGRQTILEYISQNYTPGNTVISVAGNFDEEHLICRIQELFGTWKEDSSIKQHDTKIDFLSKSLSVAGKTIEQVHACVGLEGIAQADDRLYTLLAVNNIFGGNMGSYLFQRIREEQGLAYSIYSYPAAYTDNGLFVIYAGVSPSKLKSVLSQIADEMRILKKDGLQPDELFKSKEQLKGSYILGLESTGSRMTSIGKSELLLGRIRTPDEILEKIEEVSIESAYQIIEEIFDTDKLSIALVGRVSEKVQKEIRKEFIS
ncbi:MAG: pitrilysin family protein [Eubacteriales bacterium]|nr:pitrilysin family protein [Eubacteriales bacterium]